MSWTARLKAVVREALGETQPHHWHEHEGKRSSILGFDVKDAEGHLMGRFVGYIHLYGDTTPEQLAERIGRRP